MFHKKSRWTISCGVQCISCRHRWHCHVIQAQNLICKSPNSPHSLPGRSVCWNLNKIRCKTWYRGSEHCHLLQIWWDVKRNPTNPVKSNTEMGGGEWRNRRRIVNWRLWQNRGERIVFSGPNTNTNIIRVDQFDRIRIRILFVFFIMTEYEYEYYSGSEIWPNTNTNIIRAQKFYRIRIRILRFCE